MKKNILIILTLLLFQSLFAQDSTQETLPSFEIYIHNYSSLIDIIYVQIYPFSSVINGDDEFSLIAKVPNLSNNPIKYYYINGVRLENNVKKVYIPISSGTYRGLNFDCNTTNPTATDASVASYGRGIYNLIFYRKENSEYIFLGSTLYEQDGGVTYDMHIGYVDDLTPYGGSGAGLIYKMLNFTIYGLEQAVTLVNNYIKVWDPYPNIISANRREKIFGEFNYSYGTSINNPYNKLPLFSSNDCSILTGIPEQNQIFSNPYTIYYEGNITLKVNIKKNVSTPSNWIFGSLTETPPISIMSGATLNISSGTNEQIKFIMNPYEGEQYGTRLNINSGAYLTLASSSSVSNSAIIEVQNKCEIFNETHGNLMMGNNSSIYIKNGGTVILDQGCGFSGGANSKFYVEPLGLLCNKGANIQGTLTVVYVNGHHYVYCNPTPDLNFYDSTKVILSDGVIFDVPDNTTMYFTDPATVLQMDSNSTIRFGENSKLVFQNGARLNAYKAKFESLNENSVWDGIYLQDIANDTLRYCTIENAMNGINIINLNKGEQGEIVPTAEISNCVFRNTTDYNLINGVYATNSENILLRNNSFESTILTDGFWNGFTIDYCPSGHINILDNTIDYSTTGILVMQSSPYIERNNITGHQNFDYGILLDNSNSVIKYNNTINFRKSLITFYSSPYLFRNFFQNSTENNLEFNAYSIPFMKPVNAESEIWWLGGNNTVSGYPFAYGIGFFEESYPEMNDGLNIENVNGANYMKGDIPGILDSILYEINNYWGEEFPSQNKFDVNGGTVIYTPTYDGSSPVAYDDINLYSIGFELYDTVYTKSLAFSPGGNSLFMQAYKKEKQKDYTNAIGLYKQVITNHKKTFYSAASIGRIFNCLEKSAGNLNRFIVHQNYLTQLKTNNNYPYLLRELAEDYIIKCKVKRGLLDDAISDYQTMYLQNTNKKKGYHALLNKLCLLAIKQDTTDNPQQNILSRRKLDLYSMINKGNIKLPKTLNNNTVPVEYQLFQNFPNPFNPTTTIKYAIPKAEFVTIIIYDITGREIIKLVNEYKQAGYHSVIFNGSNLASGVYFYRIEAGNFVQVKKMLLIK